MILQKLRSGNLIDAPRWLVDNVHYLTRMGSEAYGVSDSLSDIDAMGFCMPHKEMIFPHLAGEIPGFGVPAQRFDQWQQHHVIDVEHEYDFTVYSIVRYLHLCMNANPNLIDSLFTPRRCLMFTTQVGETVRDNRKLFLHKGAWEKYRNYAFSQITKIERRVSSENPKRAGNIQKFGYDLKFALHAVRLLDEVEQILVDYDLDLERSRERLMEIKRGEWTLDRFLTYCDGKERALQAAYTASKIPEAAEERKIKTLLLNCLEMHFGSLEHAVRRDSSVDGLIRDIETVLAAHSRLDH